MLKKLKRMYPHQSLMTIFIIGLLATIGSFALQYLFKVEPCTMCYWQRYLVIAITVVAFGGTLIRGRRKKWFLATICLLATCALVVATWQSLAQRDIVKLPGACQAPKNNETMANDTANKTETLLVKLEENNFNFVDCSKPEDFILYNKTGITLANLNAVLMLLVAVFSFYKLFFKPRKRFRRYNNNKRPNHHNHNNKHHNNNRRHRGSGYRRSNHRNHKNHHKNND